MRDIALTIFLIVILAIILTVPACSQYRMTEREAIQKSHIDFSREYLYFVLHGEIEIDGHTFTNDTSSHPIIYWANLDGVTIIDTLTRTQYTHRTCGVKGCQVIHLIVKAAVIPSSPKWWDGTYKQYYDNLLWNQ